MRLPHLVFLSESSLCIMSKSPAKALRRVPLRAKISTTSSGFTSNIHILIPYYNRLHG